MEGLVREFNRLLDLVQKQPHTAYLEAVQRACDEQLGLQKHKIRELEARLQKEIEMEQIKAELSYDEAFESLSTCELVAVMENAIEEALGFLEANQDEPLVTILLTIKR